MDNKMLWIGGGAALLFLLLLSKGGSGGGNVTLASQQLASAQDTTLGQASIAAGIRKAELSAGVETAKITSVSQVVQAALMQKTELANIAANRAVTEKQIGAQVEQATLAYKAATNPRMFRLQAHIADAQIASANYQAQVQANANAFAQRTALKAAKSGNQTGLISQGINTFAGLVGSYFGAGG